MNAQEMYLNLITGSLASSESLSSKEQVLRSQLRACFNEVSESVHRQVPPPALEALRDRLVRVLSISVEVAALKTGIKSQNETLLIERVANELSQYHQEGVDEHKFEPGRPISQWLDKLSYANHIGDTPLIIRSLGSVFAKLDMDFRDIFSQFLAQPLLSQYLQSRGFPVPFQFVETYSEGKPDVDWFKEIVGVILMDDPYASMDHIRSSSFAIMDDIKNSDSKQACLAQ